MATKTLTSVFLLLLSITFFFSSSSAHNITRLLSNYPDFSAFNALLSSTNLGIEINHRRTITILAVSNASIGSVASLSPDLQHRILSIHVILDYFDIEKFQNLRNHSTILTTLFQTSGIAEGRTGFLNVTKFVDGRVAFGSAASGASLVADLVGPVASKPYNISVLQVSSIIIPPGIDALSHNSTPAPPSPLSPPPSPSSPPPSPPSPKDAETPAPGKAEAPFSEGEAPTADAPTTDIEPADTPVANSPEVESPKGATDEEVNSGAGKVAVGASIGAIMGAVLTALL